VSSWPVGTYCEKTPCSSGLTYHKWSLKKKNLEDLPMCMLET
jgi:hypothetical protein